MKTIGFFDSGIGGLSVMRHARRRLANSLQIYVADSANAPYGGRPADFVIRRSVSICDYLSQRNVDAIVVACNTATAHAAATLRSQFDLPIIAMEPAVKPASATTKTGRVAVLATEGTLSSERYAELVTVHGQAVTVIHKVCHHWVEALETNVTDDQQLQEMVRADIQPLLDDGVDTLVLGCTHFPFLLDQIRETAGDDVAIIDPANAVIDQLCRRLELPFESTGLAAVVELFTSGNVEEENSKIRRLLDWQDSCRTFPG